MDKSGRSINVHLGSDLKRRWVSYCEHVGRSPGASLKEAIEHQLLRPNKHAQTKTHQQVESGREGKVRFEILLTNSEKAAIQEMADVERCSSRRWIIDAIRVGLTHEPQFNMSEIDALGESNYQLLALGRNLNQIARRLNEGHYEPVTAERINALSHVIEKHTDMVSSAIRASLERWRITPMT